MDEPRPQTRKILTDLDRIGQVFTPGRSSNIRVAVWWLTPSLAATSGIRQYCSTFILFTYAIPSRTKWNDPAHLGSFHVM